MKMKPYIRTMAKEIWLLSFKNCFHYFIISLYACNSLPLGPIQASLHLLLLKNSITRLLSSFSNHVSISLSLSQKHNFSLLLFSYLLMLSLSPFLIPALFFPFFVFSIPLTMNNVQIKFCRLEQFRSDCSANWATTTARISLSWRSPLAFFLPLLFFLFLSSLTSHYLPFVYQFPLSLICDSVQRVFPHFLSK